MAEKRISDLEGPSWTDFLAQYARPVSQVLRLPGRAAIGMAQGMGGQIEEAKRQSLSAAMGGDYDPKSVLGLAMMGPTASAPMALAGKGMDPNLLATLYLQRRSPRYGADMFEIVNESGKTVGRMRTSQDVPGNVHIESIAARLGSKPGTESSKAVKANEYSQTLGLKDIRSLLMGLRGEYPEAQTLSGFRVSGAREAAGSVDRLARPDPTGTYINTQMRLPQFTEQQLATYRAGAPQASATGSTPTELASQAAFAARLRAREAELGVTRGPLESHSTLAGMQAYARQLEQRGLSPDQIADRVNLMITRNAQTGRR